MPCYLSGVGGAAPQVPHVVVVRAFAGSVSCTEGFSPPRFEGFRKGMDS